MFTNATASDGGSDDKRLEVEPAGGGVVFRVRCAKLATGKTKAKASAMMNGVKLIFFTMNLSENRLSTCDG